MKKRQLASMLLALLMIVGVACGSNGGDNAGTGDAAGSSGATGQSSAEQVLRYAIINDPDGIDPGFTQNTFAAPFLHTMFQGLVTYDLNNELIPGLAKDWTISADGTVYTFTLRDGLKWSDGSALTAEDFVYSWKRVMDPDFGSAAAQQMYLYIQNGKKANIAAFYCGKIPV